MTTAQDLMRTDYVSIDINDTISQMLGKLNKAKQHSAVVFDGKKYLGVIARRYLLTSRIDPKKMKVANILKKRSKSKTPFYVPILKPETDIKEICRLMAAADTHMLPILQKDKLLGIVSSHDVVQEIAKAYKGLKCDELSNAELITAKENDPIGKVIGVFSYKDIDHLPIVDDQNKLTGMVAVSDLLENPQFWGTSSQKIPRAASHQEGKKTGYQHGQFTSMINLPIKNCMSRKSICCTSPDTKIPEAIKIMEENNVCNIILVKYDKPVGILTIKDILVDYAK